jgi:hypothetical protein
MINAELKHREALMEKASYSSKKRIWVTFRKEGIHRYPAAEWDKTLATGDEYDVSFLAHPHRHIFHFKVGISVTHNDRDIEFIQFKRWLENLYGEKTLEVDYKSVEMIADALYIEIATCYPRRDIWITVSEDGENGTDCYYQDHKDPWEWPPEPV